MAGMGSALMGAYSKNRKKALRKRSAMSTIKPKSKKPKRQTYVMAAPRKAATPAKSDDGERIKVKKSAWRGRWHKE